MTSNLEQIVIRKFRGLSLEKQEEVLQFLDLIQQDLFEKPTVTEIQQAREIIDRAKKRADADFQKSPAQLFDEFNQIKNSITEEYNRKKKRTIAYQTRG